ncbi:MAG: N-acetyltransferase [Candidatus Thorarchaeota archaeon]|nr:MAG: N-acetyltransferase [Candidatus Thorarchaeota archaeon]
MLQGKKINLRVIENEDYELYAEWLNDPKFIGEYVFNRQRSIIEIKKAFSERNPDSCTFIVEKKDGTRIGIASHFITKYGGFASIQEIGYAMIPNERGKGYTTEVVGILVDYLFLLKDIQRIQALINEENTPSKRVLEKNGFEKEGILRRLGFMIGKHVDATLYSIIRESWVEPKVLKHPGSKE